MIMITRTLQAKNRAVWRAWLEKNHARRKEVWLVFFKKHVKRRSIPYGEAVEEALCFGWIDSLIRRIDDDKYAVKFSPRRDRSKWSADNKRLADKLVREGRMTEAGLAKLTYKDHEDDYGRTPERRAEQILVPDYLMEALAGNRKARENFDNLAPSYRRTFVAWMTAARTEKTRDRRVKEAVELLAKNEKLGMR